MKFLFDHRTAGIISWYPEFAGKSSIYAKIKELCRFGKCRNYCNFRFHHRCGNSCRSRGLDSSRCGNSCGSRGLDSSRCGNSCGSRGLDPPHCGNSYKKEKTSRFSREIDKKGEECLE
ncbi:hypothetical protein CH370_05045 [Leptospira kmetyi]|nr:hypothetical protein CH370_05045 [Leptospira kmetyi]